MRSESGKELTNGAPLTHTITETTPTSKVRLKLKKYNKLSFPVFVNQQEVGGVNITIDDVMTTPSEAVDGDGITTSPDEPGHMTPSTNQNPESKSIESLSVSSLLTQPEGKKYIIPKNKNLIHHPKSH